MDSITARIHPEDVRTLKNVIDSWRRYRIVEVSALNDLFALTEDGHVLCWTFPDRRGPDQTIRGRIDYPFCSTWEDIAHIHAGYQAICGITHKGTAMVSYPWDMVNAGAAETCYVKQNQIPFLYQLLNREMIRIRKEQRVLHGECYEGVRDAIPYGSDDECRFLVMNNGDLRTGFSENVIASGIDRLIGYGYWLLAITNDRRLVPIESITSVIDDEIGSWRSVVSAAIASADWSRENTIVIAVTQN